MATKLDVTSLTLNPKEQPDFEKFVFEQVFDQPVLNSLHAVWTGVTMQEQIVFAGLPDKVGITDDSCTRPNSGAGTALTQKYWTPYNVGDTLINCQADLNALFKAYFDKIKTYEEKFDITGSDMEKFLAARFEDAIMKSIYRLAWFGDTSVAVAAAGAAGVTASAKVKYYDVIDGIWSEIFTLVAASSVNRYEITENSEATNAAMTSIDDGRAIEIFETMWGTADSRLRADARKQFLVSREIWENYRKYLQSKGENFTIQLTTEGLPSLKWNGVPVINMETIWDLDLRADFYNNSTDNLYYLPNRVVLTVPENIPIGTLNDGDFSTMEAWYERKERQNYMAFGYSLDAKVLESYMIEVAY